MAHLTDREMAQVDVALMASLDLHPLPRQAKVRPVGPDVDDAALALIALRFFRGFPPEALRRDGSRQAFD